MPMGFMESGGPAELLRAKMEASVVSVRNSSELLSRKCLCAMFLSCSVFSCLVLPFC